MPRPVSYYFLFFNEPRPFLIKVFLIKNTACMRVQSAPVCVWSTQPYSAGTVVY